MNPPAVTVRPVCLNFGGCATVEKASPECLEPLHFSEVRRLTQIWSTRRPRAGSVP